MMMVRHVHAGLITVMVLAVVSSAVYWQFSLQKDVSIKELEHFYLEFKTVTNNESTGEVIDIGVLRYSDVTYIDVVLIMGNRGENDLFLRSPMVDFYLEGVYVDNKTFSDITLPKQSSSSIPFDDLEFETGLIDEAFKVRASTADVLNLTAVFSSEHTFELGGLTLKTYRLERSASGDVLLWSVFGGRTQEEAVEEIIEQTF